MPRHNPAKDLIASYTVDSEQSGGIKVFRLIDGDRLAIGLCHYAEDALELVRRDAARQAATAIDVNGKRMTGRIEPKTTMPGVFDVQGSGDKVKCRVPIGRRLTTKLEIPL